MKSQEQVENKLKELETKFKQNINCVDKIKLDPKQTKTYFKLKEELTILSIEIKVIKEILSNERI